MYTLKKYLKHLHQTQQETDTKTKGVVCFNMQLL